MRRNKFLAGYITIPSVVCASVCSHSVTSKADDNSLSVSEYLALLWNNPGDSFSYCWWYICSMIKGFDKEGVQNVIKSYNRTSNAVNLDRKLRANLFSDFRDSKNMKIMTKWYIEIMELKSKKKAKDKNSFDEFVRHFEALLEKDFDKFSEEKEGIAFDKRNFLVKISKWALKNCSDEFRVTLWKTVGNFSGMLGWKNQVQNYLDVLTGSMHN